jgi:hypothetical protein
VFRPLVVVAAILAGIVLHKRKTQVDAGARGGKFTCSRRTQVTKQGAARSAMYKELRARARGQRDCPRCAASSCSCWNPRLQTRIKKERAAWPIADSGAPAPPPPKGALALHLHFARPPPYQAEGELRERGRHLKATHMDAHAQCAVH